MFLGLKRPDPDFKLSGKNFARSFLKFPFTLVVTNLFMTVPVLVLEELVNFYTVIHGDVEFLQKLNAESCQAMKFCFAVFLFGKK